MAAKKKRKSARVKTTVLKKPLSSTVRKRLKKVPGSARQYIDPKTKKIYSRRQFEKGRAPLPRKNAPEVSRKYQKYLTIRDVYISAHSKNGRILTKRQVMESKKFQRLVKELHTHDTNDKNNSGKLIRQKAWNQITGGEKSEWVPYVKRWVKGDL